MALAFPGVPFGALPPYHPPGGATLPTGNGLVVTATDRLGQLHLIALHPKAAPGMWGWMSIATRGGRHLAWGWGSFILDEGTDPCMKAVSCATNGYGPPGDPGMALVTLFFLQTSPDWGEEASGRFAAFERTCGRATLELAAAGGNPLALASFDTRQGATWIDRFAARHPLLLGCLVGCHLQPTGDIPAFDPDASNRVIAAAVAERLFALEDAATPLVRCVAVTEHARAIALLLDRAGGCRPPSGVAVQTIRLCGLAPRDWMPDSDDGVTAMAEVLQAARALWLRSRGSLPFATLIAPVRGDWTGFRDTLRAADARAVADPDVWAADVGDMGDAFVREALLPAVAHAGWALGGDGALAATSDAAVESGAWTTLFGGKGLVAIAEAGVDWHRRGPDITMAVSAMSGRRQLRWPRPCQDFTASNGRTIVPILSQAALTEEGAAMRHCVAGYAASCESGARYVLSVRDAAGARSATLDLSTDWRAVELRGIHNRAPAQEDRDAVAELCARLVAANRKPRLPWRSRIATLPGRLRRALVDATAPEGVSRYAFDPRDVAKVRIAHGLWERYLPRPARASVAALVVRIDPMGADRLERDGSPPLPIARSGVLKAIPILTVQGWRALPNAVQGGIAFCVMACILCSAFFSIWAIVDASNAVSRREEQALDGARATMLADDGRPRWGHVRREDAGTSAPRPPATGRSSRDGAAIGMDFKAWSARHPDGTEAEYFRELTGVATHPRDAGR